MLGSPGGSSGEAVDFLAVPKCLGSGTANPLTHMFLLPGARWGRGRAGGQALEAHAAARPGSQWPHAGRQALRYVTV